MGLKLRDLYPDSVPSADPIPAQRNWRQESSDLEDKALDFYLRAEKILRRETADICTDTSAWTAEQRAESQHVIDEANNLLDRAQRLEDMARSLRAFFLKKEAHDEKSAIT